VLKEWLKHLNLTTKILRDQITLTKSGNALHWPLDITVCQNDKLIYVAPPVLHDGLIDKLKAKRIQIVKRKHDRLDTKLVVSNPQVNDIDRLKMLNELRKVYGLPVVKASQYKANDIMVSPTVCQISEMKIERDFVYFNLNGGNSWGYYHPVGNAEFIYNFKGEPTYRTSELLPNYKPASPEPVDTGSVHHFIFHELQQDRFYCCEFDEGQNKLGLFPVKTQVALRNYVKNFGVPMPDPVPLWSVQYNPHDSTRVDWDAKYINTYIPPEPLPPVTGKAILHWPTIRAVIRNAVGTGPTFTAFVNWLAYIVTKKEKTRVAWLLQGVEGTGKGVLMSQIITPLLGASNVRPVLMSDLADKFNGWMQDTLLVFHDETQLAALSNGSEIMAKLRNNITDKVFQVRRMHQEHRSARNYANFLFASNHRDSVKPGETDRRYNVGVYQTEPLFKRGDDEARIAMPAAIAKELPAFLQYLISLDVTEEMANELVESDARKEMLDTNRTSIEIVASHIRSGDMEYLVSLRNTSDMQGVVDTIYNALIDRLLRERPDRILRDDLHTIFKKACGTRTTPEAIESFTRLVKKYHIEVKPMYFNGKTCRGTPVIWMQDEAWFKAQLDINTNVIPLKAVK